MLRVYVAGAIGANDAGRPARLAAGRAAWRAVLEAGFAPMAQHFFTAAEPGADALLTYQQWLDVDAAWLDVADAVLWDRTLTTEPSSGSEGEIRRAIARGIPVFRALADLIEWGTGTAPDPLIPLREAVRDAQSEYRRIAADVDAGRLRLTPEELDAQREQVQIARVRLARAQAGRVPL